jgi:hypothetical protein
MINSFTINAALKTERNKVRKYNTLKLINIRKNRTQ